MGILLFIEGRSERAGENRAPSPAATTYVSFGGMAADNRWLIRAKIIPWTEFEAEHTAIFTASIVTPAKIFRMALGALIIKEKLSCYAARSNNPNIVIPCSAGILWLTPRYANGKLSTSLARNNYTN
ncbi:hypothetical protein IQ231_18935 [Cuspidothrix issatschenkoi LEGE 03284]|nr:hypothetical protein [Cuspidothrix issatschenkoi LEGE 03284]